MNLILGKVLWGRNVVLGNVAYVVSAFSLALGSFRLLVVVDVIELASNKRLDIGCLAGAIKVDGPKQISVVRHRQRWHA